jgi:hypothetical protein
VVIQYVRLYWVPSLTIATKRRRIMVPDIRGTLCIVT